MRRICERSFWLLLAAVLLIVIPTTILAEPADPPPAPPLDGTDCQTPADYVIPPWQFSLQITGLSTCSRVDNYNSTCLGSYDSGKDFIIRLEVQQAFWAQIELDPRGTGWTGIAIARACPTPCS